MRPDNKPDIELAAFVVFMPEHVHLLVVRLNLGTGDSTVTWH